MPYRNGVYVDWKKTIDIASIIGGEPKPTESERFEVAMLVEAKMRANGFLSGKDDDLDEILYMLKDCCTEGPDEFIFRLSELYDWADANLIWLGVNGA